MRTGMKATLTHQVHYLLFATACVLLVAVALTARIMVDDLSSMADTYLHSEDYPAEMRAGI